MAGRRAFAIIPINIDFSEIAKKIITEKIEPMPGNNGQQTLVDKLIKDMEVVMKLSFVILVRAHPLTIIEIDFLNAKVKKALKMYSNHPEAIEIIMETAEDTFNAIAENLEELINNLDVIGDFDMEIFGGTPRSLTSSSYSLALKNSVGDSLYRSGGGNTLRFLQLLGG